MEKLTGKIMGQVLDVEGADGRMQKQFHYFVETEPGKRKEIVIEGEPPYQKSATLHPLLHKRCQVEGDKLAMRLVVQKENIKVLNEAISTRGKKQVL